MKVAGAQAGRAVGKALTPVFAGGWGEGGRECWGGRGLAEMLPSPQEISMQTLPALSPRGSGLAFGMMEGPRHRKVVYWPCRVQGPHVTDLVPLPL